MSDASVDLVKGRRAATEHVAASTLAPPWVRALGVAAWVTDPNQRICYANRRAASLLRLTTEQCRAYPCYEIVRSRRPTGAPFCQHDCPLNTLRTIHRGLEPVILRLPCRDGPRPWIQLLPIPLRTSEKPAKGIVHCALDLSTGHARVDRYLRHIAFQGSTTETSTTLSPREREIIALLARDLGLREIARKLSISHTTVRNHVQHILAKLGVHSMKEAIAVYLLALERDAPSCRVPTHLSGLSHRNMRRPG